MGKGTLAIVWRGALGPSRQGDRAHWFFRVTFFWVTHVLAAEGGEEVLMFRRPPGPGSLRYRYWGTGLSIGVRQERAKKEVEQVLCTNLYKNRL